MLRLALAVLHLLALGIGLGAVHARARALDELAEPPHSDGALRRAFVADAWWGVAGALWIATGLWRALAGTEKAPGYYWSHHVFLAKMGLLVVLLLLEIGAAVAITRWRIGAGRRTLAPLETLAGRARRLARVSHVQTALVLAMLVAAVVMARGYGAR